MNIEESNQNQRKAAACSKKKQNSTKRWKIAQGWYTGREIGWYARVKKKMAYIKNLREKRQRTGMSQNALAGKAGVYRDTVSRCENEYDIRPEKAFKILNALNSHEYYWNNKIPESEIKDGGRTGAFPKKSASNGGDN